MKTYIINGIICAFCAFACALNIGVVIRAWIDLQTGGDVYDENDAVQGMVICSVCVFVAVVFLSVFTWLFVRESEKYGI